MVVEDEGKIYYKDNDKYIKIYDYGEACIFDVSTERLHSRYKIINNKFDYTEIYDKKYSHIMEEILTKSESKKLKILLEEPFNLISAYIEENKINCSLFLINNSENKKILDHIGTKSENKNVDVNIYSYLNKLKENEGLDFIILIDNHFFFIKIDIIPKTLFIDNNKLAAIQKNLNDGGKFCFNLLIKNPFLLEKVKKKLSSFFKKVETFKTTCLDILVMCSNK